VKRVQRTSPLSVLASAVIGIAVGVLIQVYLSSRGGAPLVPPISLAATLLVLAAVLVVLAVLLRRAVNRSSQRPVNPFHAVRLLAGARAGQFAGALFGGFGAGLAMQLLTRGVMAPTSTWVPMLLVAGAGAVLLICGVIAESLCRVPPDDPEAERTGGGPDSAPQQPSEHPA